MIKNYFIIGYRNFKRGHIYSFISLFGLAIGLSSVMLIILYIQHELSFDKHFPHSERVYQLVMESNDADPGTRTIGTPEPLGKTLQSEFSEVEVSTALLPFQTTYLVNDRPVELNLALVNPTFFQVFDLPLIKGNKAFALKDQSGVVLTQTTAQKLFPGTEAIGKILTRKSFDGTLTHYTVTAVMQDIPQNSHYTADVIVSQPVTDKTLDFTGYSSLPQYILLKPHVDAQKLEAKMQGVLEQYKLSKKTHIQLLPLTDVYLHAGKVDAPGMTLSDIRYIYIFGFAALLILMIGCINYVNLTTARALQRVKEVGIRKTLGSGRGQLAFQFIGESLFVFILSSVLAFIMSIFSLPVFNKILGSSLEITDLFTFQSVALFTGITLVCGLLAGSYPAIFLSRMQPAGILKSNNSGTKFDFSLRKILIVVQFTISVALIVSTTVVWQQLKLFNNRPLGFNKDHLILLPTIHFDKKPEAFKTKLLSNANVVSVSLAELNMGNPVGNTSSMADPADSTRRLEFGFVFADFDFVQTMGIKLKDGRTFSAQFPGDMVNYDSLQTASNDPHADEILYREPIVITQSLAKAIGLKSPVNEVIKLNALHGTVIGVVQDFQVTSLKDTSPLLVYKPKKNHWFSTTTYVRVNNKNIAASIAHLEQTWKAFFPDHTFHYTFADDKLQKLYESESRLASIFTSFALVAIALSALGLFSLAALIVKQRTKEIGIRKVLGASVYGITLMLSGEFLMLILIAVAIASPIAWYAMEQWLRDFAHRVNIQWTVFILASVLALLTGMLAVFLQAIKAAKSNPVRALKNE